MFKKISQFEYKRSVWEAVGFYIAYLLVLFLIQIVMGVTIGLVIENDSTHFLGIELARLSSIVFVLICIFILYFVLRRKALLSFPKAIFWLLIVAIFSLLGGGLLGLLPIAYLTTKPNPLGNMPEVSKESKPKNPFIVFGKISLRGVVYGGLTDFGGTSIFGVAYVLVLAGFHHLLQRPLLPTSELLPRILAIYHLPQYYYPGLVLGGIFSILGSYIAASYVRRYKLLNSSIAFLVSYIPILVLLPITPRDNYESLPIHILLFVLTYVSYLVGWYLNIFFLKDKIGTILQTLLHDSKGETYL